ncbi:MFS transporter [Thermococcus sp. CX2]|uniref:MFS transporter n=1 Tax=Thermococcus sp. CX2 TaxID=163006 RepID=UPI001F0D233D|nr:MFS transporter [Thermococcus sp. CX2]
MHKPNHESWFYSFVPFKVSAGGTAPLIPILTLEVGGGPTEVGVVNAVGSLASMLGGLFWGKLSDRLNRRKAFLILGFLGSAIATFFFSLARTVHQVMLINAVYTFFIAATIPIPILIITKTFRLEDWDHAIGRFNEIGGWAWVAGMVIGLLVVSVADLRELFVMFGIIGLFSVPLGLKTIREIPLHLNRHILGAYFGYVIEKFRYLPNMITHLPRFSTGGVGELYISSLLFWVGAMLYFSQFPVLLKANGFGTFTIYAMSIVNSAVSAFMYTRVGRSIKQNGGKSALFKGLSLRAFAFSLLALSTVSEGRSFIFLAAVSYFLAGYTWSFISISTTSLISRNAPPKKRGALIGTYNLISSLGAIAGNFLSGVITSTLGFTVNFTIASLLLLLSIIPLGKGARGLKA